MRWRFQEHERWSELDPAIFVPGVGDANGNCTFNGQRVPYTVSPVAACSTTGNTNQRRILYLQNPAQGQFYNGISQAGDDGTRSFNAMVLSIQKRRTKGVTILANYTLSHCIDDGLRQDLNTGQIAERRRLDRGNCELDRRQNFNTSAVYETPQFSNGIVRILATSWQISGIVRILAGRSLSVLSGLANPSIVSALYDNPPCLISCALEKRPCTPDSGIPSLRSRNSRIGQGWKTAFIFPMLLTTGRDDNRDTNTTDRPFGVRRNSLTSPSFFEVDLKFSKTFNLVREDPGAAAGPVAGGGYFGRRRGVRVTMTAEAQNVLNKVNYSRISGVLTSPFFGKPIRAETVDRCLWSCVSTFEPRRGMSALFEPPLSIAGSDDKESSLRRRRARLRDAQEKKTNWKV